METKPPVIDPLLLTETTINCPAIPNFTQATATDDINQSVTLTFEDQKIQGPCALIIQLLEHGQLKIIVEILQQHKNQCTRYITAPITPTNFPAIITLHVM
jgi:hypothetical protein